MGCMTDFGYVILDTNLPTFMTIQACIMPAQILAITEGPNAADQKAQYQELKDLVMKTYTTANAPVQARDALFAISIAILGFMTTFWPYSIQCIFACYFDRACLAWLWY